MPTPKDHRTGEIPLPPLQPATGSARPLRILIAEDSEADAELILHELRRAGFQLAVKRVEREDAFRHELEHFAPQVLLADYKLPGFDGRSVMEIAHALMPDLPVIFVSGTIGEETAVELLKGGATDYVLKNRLERLPLAIRRALAEVAERLARRRAEMELRQLNQELEDRVAERTRELLEKNDLLEQELRMARELQTALLPRRFPSVPPGAPAGKSAVRFLSFYRPSGIVSGDFFDVVRLSDTKVGVFLCDVMGHDVRAALVATMMRALIEQLSQTMSDPGRVLTRINRDLISILRQSDTTMFATAFYLVADLGRNQLMFANAGHPAPLHIHRQNGKVEPMGSNGHLGPALGLLEESTYTTGREPIQPDDFVMLFTDGFFEVEDPESHEFYCKRRLMEAVRQRILLPADELFQGVLDEVRTFARRDKFDDDVCLLGLELRPTDNKAAATTGVTSL